MKFVFLFLIVSSTSWALEKSAPTKACPHRKLAFNYASYKWDISINCPSERTINGVILPAQSIKSPTKNCPRGRTYFNWQNESYDIFSCNGK